MKKDTRTEAQILLAEHHLPELGLVCLCEQYFSEERNWRFDVFIPQLHLAIEIHGGQHTGGHRRGAWSGKEAARRKAKGLVDTPQEDEYTKLNAAQMAGFRVLQFTNEQVKDGRAKAFIAGYVK